MRIKKGDRVQVLQGKDRGKRGVVLKVLPREGKVIVEGINRAKRHTKARSATQQGGIMTKDMPVDAAVVAVVSPGDDKPTRVGFRFDPGSGQKVRICKRTGADI